MPRVYRIMKQAQVDLLPVVGDAADKLGIRDKDLAPDADGNAVPGNGGMSVVSCIAGLRRRTKAKRFPYNMVPQRLHDAGRVPGAIGQQSLHLFRHGEGAFEMSPITEHLQLIPDQYDHGTVQPTVTMVFAHYKSAIVATRSNWSSGEGDPDE